MGFWNRNKNKQTVEPTPQQPTPEILQSTLPPGRVGLLELSSNSEVGDSFLTLTANDISNIAQIYSTFKPSGNDSLILKFTNNKEPVGFFGRSKKSS